MEKIITHEIVSDKLDSLINILYEEGYFDFKENAREYVIAIYEFINTIPKRPHRLTRNNKHGTYFCTFKANSRTTWYISFDKDENTYLIKNITNNHSKDYPDFIGSHK
jgi:signal transduction histidine kinase